MERNAVTYLQSVYSLNAFPCSGVLHPSGKACYNVYDQELVQMASKGELRLPNGLTDCTTETETEPIKKAEVPTLATALPLDCEQSLLFFKYSGARST